MFFSYKIAIVNYIPAQPVSNDNYIPKKGLNMFLKNISDV